GAPPIVGTGMQDISQRPAQQEVMINEGIATAGLATTRAWIDSRAPLLEGRAPMAGEDPSTLPGYFPAPTIRNSIPIGDNTYTSWIWGEGRGQTRTGMPVSISAPELTNPATTCPHNAGQDSRHWPMYPDKTFSVPAGSAGTGFAQTNILDPGNPAFAGSPGLLTILNGLNNGYHPTYSISSTVSGWEDLNGDGIPEFVATPAWIDKFSLDPLCPPFNNPFEWPALLLNERTLDSFYAHEPSPAADSTNKVDTEWHLNSL